jgi:hypothetical protein
LDDEFDAMPRLRKRLLQDDVSCALAPGFEGAALLLNGKTASSVSVVFFFVFMPHAKRGTTGTRVAEYELFK